MGTGRRSRWEDWGPPIVVGGLAVTVFAIWAAKGAGYARTTWYPGGLFLLGLLAVVIVAAPQLGVRLRRPTAIAAAFLFAYAVWSYASIAWSSARADAWTGANRSLLYVGVYLLFALLPWSAGVFPVLPAAFGGAVAVIGFVDVARAPGDPSRYFIYGRLAAPAGYPNASCALFVICALPLLYLAGRKDVHPVLRGLVMVGAGALAQLALLTESRASLIAVPIGTAAYLALVRERVRSLWPLVAVAVALAASAPVLLGPYSPLNHREDASHELHRVVAVILITGFVLAVVWILFAVADRRVRLREGVARMTGIGLLGAAAVSAVAAAVVFLASSPVRTIEHAWQDFKSGYPAATSSSSHFTSGLGNNRYDFWRVALIEFRDHPVGGVGADNFAEDYVQRRRSREEPLFPHSLELRVLAQTGLVGTLLFAGFVVAAAWAAPPVFRRTDLAGGVARAGLAATAYWAIHGSIDWFWEFPGLAAPALAWLAMGAGLHGASAPKVHQRAPGALRAAGVFAVALAAAAFTLPWLSERLQLRAADIWRGDRTAAFDDLATARTLNPLSPAPDVIDGAIASRLGDLGRMRRAFRRALARDDRQWYSHFELALADASSGQKHQALRELVEAARLNPQEPMVRVVRQTIVAGRALDRSAIDRVFVNRVRVLVGR